MHLLAGSILAVIMLSMLAGCATADKPYTSAPVDKVVWPPPPLEPRIAWVQSIATPEDAGIRKGFWGRLWSTMVGQEPSRIVRPYGVYVDRKKRIYIADTGGNSVHVIDRAGGRYDILYGSGEHNFQSPIGITVDGFSRAYVTDSAAGKVYRFSIDNLQVEPFIVNGLQRPTGISYNPLNQQLYVSDTLAGQIVVFSLKGEELFRFGAKGDSPGEFNHPTDLTIDRRGRVFVTDALNSRIQVFASDGSYLRGFGESGDASGKFAKPKGIAIDSEDHIHVVDALFDTVQIFDEDGHLLLSYGARGNGSGELWMPSGLFIDYDDFIYVSDTYNNRILLYQYVWESWKE
jgi:DNA-binding beta-propeller fold protein YncE